MNDKTEYKAKVLKRMHRQETLTPEEVIEGHEAGINILDLAELHGTTEAIIQSAIDGTFKPGKLKVNWTDEENRVSGRSD